MLELFPDIVGNVYSSDLPVTAEDQALENLYPMDFDILSLMNSAEDPDTGLIRDLKVNDQDLRSAKNYHDYIYKVIGKDAHPPWLIQMWITLMLLGETCPRCSDSRWYNLEYVVAHVPKDEPAERITEHLKLLVNGVCPKCKTHKQQLIDEYGLKNYNEAVLVLGQRSGKSATAASISAYLTHRYLKFPKLATMTTAMQKSTELSGTFVSLTFGKALSLLWTPYMNIINESRWFTEYHQLLDHSGEKYGMELYRRKDEFLKYFHKGLRFYPTHPNGSVLRGDTRILGALDELGLFPLPTGKDEEDETSVKANADEAHKSLTNSLATVQAIYLDLLKRGYNPPPALMLGVSSPFSERDKVMRLLALSRDPEAGKFLLGVNLPTWEVNPHINRDHPIIVTAYASNPEKAERDFGANPPRVSSTFIHRNSIQHEDWVCKPTHQMTYMYDKPGLIYAKVQKIGTVQHPSILCLDAGVVNNSFCLSGAHFDFNTQKTKISTLLEIMPHDGRRIDFNALYQNVILPVAKDINAVAILADQWQSIDLLSRAKDDMGNYPNGKPLCMTKQYSPRRKDFEALVAMMTNHSMQLPFITEQEWKDVMDGKISDFHTLNGKPSAHLLLQMLTVMDIGPNKAPTKGPGFTDDLFRSLVLTVKIHEPAIMARLHEWKDNPFTNAKTQSPRPVSVGRSGYGNPYTR